MDLNVEKINCYPDEYCLECMGCAVALQMWADMTVIVEDDDDDDDQ